MMRDPNQQISPMPTGVVPDSVRVFGRDYFENYRGPGQFYWDHPCNEIAFRKVMDRRPKSVVEIGCGRGYVLKRLEDSGVFCQGYEISKHCFMTQASKWVLQKDITGVWGEFRDKFDLCLSIGVLEHIPESLISQVLAEASRVCQHQLHAIVFEGQEPWPDKTRVTLKPAEWWYKLFRDTGTRAEVVPLHEFLSGSLPPEYLKGDGRVKLNIGCFMTMFHNGWANMDVHDLKAFAQSFGYNYVLHDASLGLPHGTGTVDLIYHSHMLEHLSYAEGVSFLRECRRVIRPDGAMRIIVPDAGLLNWMYCKVGDFGLFDFDEVNGGCANSPTAAGKFWALLHEGHRSCYDAETLIHVLGEAGWEARAASFRQLSGGVEGSACEHPGLRQILRETLDMLPCLSLYVDAVPKVG